MIPKIPTKVTSTRSTQSLRTCYGLSRTNITKPPPIPSTMNSKISPSSSHHSLATLKQLPTATTATRSGPTLSLRSTRCPSSSLWLQLMVTKLIGAITKVEVNPNIAHPLPFSTVIQEMNAYYETGNQLDLLHYLSKLQTRCLYPEIIRTNSRFRFQHQSPFGLLGLPRMLRSSRHQRLHQSQESRSSLGLQHA